MNAACWYADRFKGIFARQCSHKVQGVTLWVKSTCNQKVLMAMRDPASVECQEHGSLGRIYIIDGNIVGMPRALEDRIGMAQGVKRLPAG